MNLLNYFQQQVNNFPDKIAYLFLADGEKETAQISYQQLDKRAKAIAGYLQQQAIEAQQRVGLLYPSGIEFVAAFLGCLYAGVIAVPLSYPTKANFKQVATLLEANVKSSEMSAILTIKEFTDLFFENMKEFPCLAQQKIWQTEKIDSELEKIFFAVSIEADAIACLLYTSGSTTSPKAVMITHMNLVSNLLQTAEIWNYSANSISLTWSSHAHVYGLTTGLLLSLMNGACCIIMPTLAFILRPINWLNAITKYKVTHSGCPNFGYEICINRIKDAQLVNINLSSWKVAINGGEMVQATTLEEFCNKFYAYGFRYENFCPAYGMSEMTGLIAASKIGEFPVRYEKSNNDSFQLIDSKFLTTNKNNLISCGTWLKEILVKIIDPQTLEILPNEEVGEICLTGTTCIPGYWRSVGEEERFILLEDNNSYKKYLRTGDLGLIKNNELLLTGRLKEIIIIAGKNHHPLDIEITVANSHHYLNHDNIAFSLILENQEKLFIVQEVDIMDEGTYQNMVMIIRKSVSDKHNLDTHGILLISVGGLPKTISGKKQRQLCKEYYLSGNFHVLYQDIKFG